MSELRMAIPNEANWPERTLDQMCVVISRGTAPVYVEHSDVMAIGQRCVSNSGFDGDKARPHSIRAMLGVLMPESGDVLLNSTGTGTIGRSCTFDHPGAYMVDGHVTLLRSKLGQFEGQWLDAVLRASWGQNHLERFCYSGSTNQVELNRSQLATTQLPVPCIEEQRAISRVLDTLDTTIRQTEAIIAKLQQVKQGLLHDLLTRGIDANGHLRPPVEQAPHLYKESPLGWIPREWEVASLLDRVSPPQGQVSPLKMPYSNWILIAPDHIESGTGTILSKVTAAEQGAISGKYIFQTGDIIYSKIRPYLRKAALADSQGLCSADMYPLRPSLGVDSRFVLALILSEIFTTFAVSVSMRTGIPKINREELSDFAFGWPSSEEQIQIADMLSAQERKIASSSEELLKLKNLKSALMDDLLTGRVRVTALLSGETPVLEELERKSA